MLSWMVNFHFSLGLFFLVIHIYISLIYDHLIPLICSYSSYCVFHAIDHVGTVPGDVLAEYEMVKSVGSSVDKVE